MNLKVVELTRTLIDTEVTKVLAEDGAGFFGLLPKHVDFVTVLVPGILTFSSMEGGLHYVALEEGILVKVGRNVLVSTTRAVLSDELSLLKETVEKEFAGEIERGKKVRAAAFRLEADLARRFFDLGMKQYA